MKNWFDNLSVNKQRAISLVLIIIGSIFLVVAIDNLLLLIFALPFLVIGFALLVYIEKREKRKKDSEIKKIKDDYHYHVSYEKQQEVQIQENNNLVESFVIPEGKEVYDYRIVETRIRGVFYNDIYNNEVEKDDEVAIKHNPTPSYSESTDVILISDGTQLGYLMKEMAMEFVEKYGEKFCFIGKIIDYEQDEYDDEGKLSKIIIQFKVPKFKKIANKK